MTTNSATRVAVFLDEYSRDDTIAKYLRETAGAGIAYALTHVYAPVYRRIVQALIAQRPPRHTFRVLEYGCGGGMNLLKVIELFRQAGVDAPGCGTDFSPPMIEAARQEAARHLPSELRQAVRFAVAGNESLAQDLAKDLGCSRPEVDGSFDVVVGVNTFRYCHRLNKETECARDIFDLLRPGGYSIMIDMNRRFPLFRSKVTDLLKRRPDYENHLPSLEEYTRPFALAGFRIVETRNFCWVPHSASPPLVAICRALTPVLDRCCSQFAMRALVIAQKAS